MLRVLGPDGSKPVFGHREIRRQSVEDYYLEVAQGVEDGKTILAQLTAGSCDCGLARLVTARLMAPDPDHCIACRREDVLEDQDA